MAGSQRFLYCLIAFVVAVAAQSDYAIDDADPAVNYSGNWSTQADDSAQLDATMVYDGTWHDGTSGIGESTCFQFDFTGTGITVYCVLPNSPLANAGNTNLTFSLNGSSPYVTTYVSTANDSATDPYTYNVSVFGVQNLSVDTYTLTVTLGENSTAVFDYAWVTGNPNSTANGTTNSTAASSTTQILTTTSCDSSSTPSKTGDTQGKMSQTVKVGGVGIGIGVGIMLLLAFLVFCLIRRQRASRERRQRLFDHAAPVPAAAVPSFRHYASYSTSTLAKPENWRDRPAAALPRQEVSEEGIPFLGHHPSAY